MNYSSYNSW